MYWMNRDCRISDNWAYIHARILAHKAKVPLIVLYNISPGFLGGGMRQHSFKIGGLQEVSQACSDAGTPFFLCTGDAKAVIAFVLKHNAHTVVTDYSPLRIQKEWLSHVVELAQCPVVQVDAHNIVPVWVMSAKPEYAARTIRPKLARLAPQFLEPFPRVLASVPIYKGEVPDINWEKVRTCKGLTPHVTEVAHTSPGHAAGMRTLEHFIKKNLFLYGDARNDPNQDGQSGLSPYLHFGHIAPATVALRVCRAYALHHKQAKQAPAQILSRLMDPRRNGSGKAQGSAESFIEELIVRRELADNFCEYTPAYDTVEGFPDWARNTLEAHRADIRPYLYTYGQLAKSLTHDSLWNAAQLQLVREGTMHGYMRMYWGKKILEWSTSPEEALAHAIRLNDTYQLDGRDPNGYAGIAWCIGGVHDRPWFNREIFGTVRYMARSGCEKKFDVPAYIARYS